MTVYSIQNSWAGTSHDGGVFNIGNRAGQLPVALNIQSNDGGRTFTGTMTYQGEGPISLRATQVTTNCYQAENHWGSSSEPWHDAGLFLLGARDGQNAVAFDLSSPDNGKTLTGTMNYAGEGPIGVQAQLSGGLAYNAVNHWGGSDEWHQGGQWVLGCRPEQPVVAIDVTSPDGGQTLTGTMTYKGEGPIGFHATRTLADTYNVQNSWNGTQHDGGTWVLGCRGTQRVVALKVAASPTGLDGTMTYAGEGPISVKLSPSSVKALAPA